MTGTTHLSALALACLSLLFGGGLCLLRECVRGILSALWLLPPPAAYRSPFPALLRRDEAPQKEAYTPPKKERTAQKAKEKTIERAKEGKREKAKERTKETRKGKRALPPHFFGYLFFDLSFFLAFAVCYLLFLFVVNEGVVRGYSLLCVLFGFLLFRKAAHRVLAVPLFRVGRFFFSLLSFLLSFLILPAVLGTRRLIRRKKEKKNLTKNEKCSIVKEMKKSKERL